MPLAALLTLAAAAAPAPSGSCRAAFNRLGLDRPEAALPGRVDGSSLSARGLVALRRARGDALVTVVGGRFAGADFRGARLHNVCFIDSDLKGSDWRGAQAAGVGFVRGDLSEANLAGARMQGAALDGVNLEHVNAAGADWSGGRFRGRWSAGLGGLVLDGARLRGFAFHCGELEEDSCRARSPVSMRRADLTRARIDSWRFEADFTRARIDRTEAGLHQLAALSAGAFGGPLVLRGGEARLAIGRRQADLIVAAFAPPEELTIQPPSFDCGAARGRVERMICSDEGAGLRAPDVELAAVYRRALAAGPSVRTGQRAWLRERNRCPDRACVERAYDTRIARLRGLAGPPDWLRPGARALFVAEPVPFEPAFRRTALYRRLVPVLIGGTDSRVAVAVERGGAIAVAGDASGANGHGCSMSGERLRFDRATGWFSGPWTPDFDSVPDRSQPPIRVLLLDGDRASVFRDGDYPRDDDPVDARPSNYMQCGARARFGGMVRVPSSAAEVERVLAALRTG